MKGKVEQPLTDAEVQELRDKAKKYAEKGKGYLEKQETKTSDKHEHGNSAFWKKLWISESDNSKWEILHDSENKTVELHYVPNDDYSSSDVKIKMQYEHFDDLVKFLIRIR